MIDLDQLVAGAVALATGIFGAVDSAATVDTTAVRGQQIQVTEPQPPPQVEPVPIPGDCDSWRAVFRHHGATDAEVEFFFGDARPWGVSRTNIIFGESGCGLRTVNPDTSDRGICQLNGIHAQPGWFWGREYGSGGWLGAEFGLRGGRVVSEEEAGDPRYAAACLFALRAGRGPDSFGGACAWRPPRFCS